ncbi:MAG: thioredoxin domain-containing protein, partial [Gammaproteobacteria bacterium]|nr:thioredoxin domain-containing protein [Gammaproteobacteria bacterium]
PILLSIGYSACHWCHVMAHESFEDETTAEVMNRSFINIKVDREERPDLDRIYQTAHQLLAQRGGGWPLTMVLTHDDQIPFFGGTYFPPEARFGLPGFGELLERIAEMYQTQLPAIRTQNDAMISALEKTQESGESDSELKISLIHQAVVDLYQYFDNKNGGHSGAPKFPQSPTQELLLSLHQLDDQETVIHAKEMVTLTLGKMANGGIYDHLGGGFCRYSVDAYWMIPHFEKMLYDNGQLLTNYVHAKIVTENSIFDTVIRETAEWIIRDMQAPDGGYYSSLDADSEGQEGKFYVWTHDKLKAELDQEEYEFFANYYGMNFPANFEGHWHLFVPEPDQKKFNALTSARSKLLDIRNQRVWPGRDEKVLTSWNGLAIKGMVNAYLVTGEDAYYHSANRALEFIYDNLWQENRLYATSKDGRNHLNAYLDDYAFLIDAILLMLTARWDNKWLDFAINLADVLLAQFYDQDHAGFFFTSHDHESLIQRRKDFMDDATPSGNGIAVQGLLRLGHLLGKQDYLDAAENTLKAAWGTMESLPLSHATMLDALVEFSHPPRQIIIRGNLDEISHWQEQCRIEVRDTKTAIYAIPENAGKLPGLLEKRLLQDNIVAYLCEGFTCKTPFTKLQQLISDLKHCEIK